MPFRTRMPIFISLDRSHVVGPDEPGGALLLVGPDGEVSDADAERYGLSPASHGTAEPDSTEDQQPAAGRRSRQGAERD